MEIILDWMRMMMMLVEMWTVFERMENEVVSVDVRDVVAIVQLMWLNQDLNQLLIRLMFDVVILKDLSKGLLLLTDYFVQLRYYLWLVYDAMWMMVGQYQIIPFYGFVSTKLRYGTGNNNMHNFFFFGFTFNRYAE